ncbi:hypothetical protein AS593_06595 [Caulobacter vibrioides]|nr:hypothetical protein AS593_06595 [Caulobacter vibrioides]
MSKAPRPGGFAARPSAPEDWIRRAAEPEAAPTATPAASEAATPSRFTARLTIDVTPALRGRIKVIAFQRGQTVADMVRALLETTFGESAQP